MKVSGWWLAYFPLCFWSNPTENDTVAKWKGCTLVFTLGKPGQTSSALKELQAALCRTSCSSMADSSRGLLYRLGSLGENQCTAPEGSHAEDGISNTFAPWRLNTNSLSLHHRGLIFCTYISMWVYLMGSSYLGARASTSWSNSVSRQVLMWNKKHTILKPQPNKELWLSENLFSSFLYFSWNKKNKLVN